MTTFYRSTWTNSTGKCCAWITQAQPHGAPGSAPCQESPRWQSRSTALLRARLFVSVPNDTWPVESTHDIQPGIQHAPHRICSLTAARPSCPTTAPRLSNTMLTPPHSGVCSTDRFYRPPYCASAVKIPFTPDLCSPDARLLQAAMPQLPRFEYAHQVELAAGTCAGRTALAHS